VTLLEDIYNNDTPASDEDDDMGMITLLTIDSSIHMMKLLLRKSISNSEDRQ